jgi:pimeloyl-ACP methyl ester carboxylesterase
MNGDVSTMNDESILTPAAAADWKEAGNYFNWKGNRVFVRESRMSEAEPLLLIHGFPTSSFDWLPVWQTLAERYHLLAFDNLGFGYSDKPGHFPYSIHAQTDLAQSLVQEYFGRDYHILAHDYGVSIGQELLARTAEGASPAVLSCMFLNGGLFASLHRARPIQRLLAGPIGGFFVKLLNRERFGKSFSEVFGPDTMPSQCELDAFWQIIRYNDGQAIQHKLLHYIKDRRQHAERWAKVIQAPPSPIALINGLLDPVSGEHLVDFVKQLSRDLPVWRLEKVGHYPQTEAPEDVLNGYFAFRESIKGH